MEQFEKDKSVAAYGKVSWTHFDLVNFVLIMILCDCLYEILKICNTLPLISLCCNLITYTVLGIIEFFYFNNNINYKNNYFFYGINDREFWNRRESASRFTLGHRWFWTFLFIGIFHDSGSITNLTT